MTYEANMLEQYQFQIEFLRFPVLISLSTQTILKSIMLFLIPTRQIPSLTFYNLSNWSFNTKSLDAT